MPHSDPLYQRGAALLRWDAAEASRNVRECSLTRTGPAGAREAWTPTTTGVAGGSGQVLVLAVGPAELASLRVRNFGRSQAEPDPSQDG